MFTKLLLILFLSFLTSCGSVSYMKTSQIQTSAKPENCSFRVFTSAPQERFEEIGILSMDAQYAKSNASNAQEFQQTLKQYVCANGGDAVIGTLNGYGWYVSGTVIKFVAK